MSKLINNIINPQQRDKQNRRMDCQCNYPDNYYGDQLCKSILRDK